MNKTFKIGAIAVAAALSLAACDKKDAGSEAVPAASAASNDIASIGNTLQQASYAMGVDIGRSLKQMKDQGTDIDLKVFNEALQTVYEGKQPKMDELQAQEVMMKFLTEQQEKAKAKQEADAKTNKEQGEAFLKENAKKEGVKTTASGLQYIIKSEGTGKQPKSKEEVVTVEYEGRLIDGTVFDSSKGKDPITIPLNQVIPGWTEGVQLLKEGGEATFFIPSELAYGDRAAGDKIGPNATLVFDVKLLKVGAAEEMPAVPPVEVELKKVQ
ncbi:FKBP-type peptidyl-prolyl cis-trans isomerase [Neisseria animalis]|uniref:Peptidyl-prolyl cis-trans isomerase n=1 Tax=Neisseria animalis TaxID=492 RepID=A0A5P3MPB0_NEIAN|nr:FKBP-type peptidyl-prolyl cis-trans isomerase [Neisseria animalis]QEY23374.1 FKBP-type peptidyl-prolyl cis-trans isomerase [Neisseria animalis]ROW33219.1 FKBP-type peptidyl-prolyl cis-trans isomerase [Neisseria animalis]VEE08787.1 peptidyl-prolyl isomerase [Neisseria animalis]